MATVPRRKSTSSTPATPRRPCTPESIVSRSPRAPGPPSSPDRRYLTSPDKPTKSYLRPTVSSTLHHGNTSAPRRSTDRPPFLPPSSVGIASVHHKNSSSHKGTLSLKSILTKANNALKVGRKSSNAGGGFGTGSTSSTPVRPRSPALVKKKEGKTNYGRSNSVPKKMEVTIRHEVEETETASIHSIEDHLHEQLPNPVDPAPPRAPEVTAEPTPPPEVQVQESSHKEKIEDVVNEEVGGSSAVVMEEKQAEEKHEEIKKVEEIEESPMENVKVIEEYREEQPKVEDEVQETTKEVEDVVIVETQEEVPKVEDIEIVKDMNQKIDDNVIVEEEIKESEVMVVKTEEETKVEEIKKESEEREKEITTSAEALKEEGESQDKVEEETPAVETETKVENAIIEKTPKEEEKPPVLETETKIEHAVVEETPKEEEKPTTSEFVEKKEDEIIVEAPTVEKKAVKIVEKKPHAVAARKEAGISNDVIEETRTKLLEKRKSKVGALVGAFETVMQ